jgi:hypothetical protein
MTLDMYFDREGQPLELMQWALTFEDRSYRVVCQTRLSDYFISTVWIGLTNSFNGLPVGTFETAIFKGPEMLDDLFRHDSQGEAVRWHLWVCSMVVRYRVKQLSRSKVHPSTDRGPQWVAVTATTDGLLTVVEAPSGLTLSSERR